jgi:hypothetical protein
LRRKAEKFNTSDHCNGTNFNRAKRASFDDQNGQTKVSICVVFCSKGVQTVNHVKKAQIGKRVCHSVTCARRQKSEREEAKNTESSHSDGS